MFVVSLILVFSLASHTSTSTIDFHSANMSKAFSMCEAAAAKLDADAVNRLSLRIKTCVQTK